MKTKYIRYKKPRGERMLRDMWGDYDANGTYIPWRFIVWSCKYGFAQSKFTKIDGKGIISFIDNDIFEKYIKPWICMTKSQRRQMREVGLDYSVIVKKALYGAKMKYQIYLDEKYNYWKEFK